MDARSCEARVEQLEPRLLLSDVALAAPPESASTTNQAPAVIVTGAASVKLSGGTLSISGSPSGDEITVRVAPAESGPATVELNKVTRIVIDAGAGNDTVRVEPSVPVPVTIAGAAGDDQIYAYASARQLVYGADGNDHLVATNGIADSIVAGGRGADSFWLDSTDRADVESGEFVARTAAGAETQRAQSLAAWQAREAQLAQSGALDRFRAQTDGSDLTFGLAWIMQGYIAAYESTGDMALLERVRQDIDYVLSVRDDKTGLVDEVRGRVVKSWSTTRDTGSMAPENVGKRHTLALFAGNILQPIARWIYLVKRDPLAMARYSEQVAQYTQAARETIAEFDSDWREAVIPGENANADRHGFTVLDGEGYYYCPVQANPMSYNRQNAMGRTLVAMYLATGDQQYFDKAAKLARHFQRAGLRMAQDGGYQWYGSYWTTGTARMEDTQHAATSVMFMVDAMRAGIVFTQADMDKLVTTFYRFTQRDASGNITGLAYRVDGTDSSSTSNLDAGAGLWGYLGLVRPQIAQTLQTRPSTLLWLHTGAWSLRATMTMTDAVVR
jgi:hypothetical protein